VITKQALDDHEAFLNNLVKESYTDDTEASEEWTEEDV
jgi:hypothetical protein